MSGPVELGCLIVAAFLLGSIPFGLLVGRTFFQTDLRTKGSGNIGAANALRTFGKGGAAAVLLLDALKGFAPVLVALHLGGAWWATGAGVAAVLGHCYSPWLRFHGGKGVATSLGVVFALCWPAALIMIAAWIVAAFPVNYSSVGSLAANAIAILPLWYFLGPPGVTYGAFTAAFIGWTHRENIARLAQGRENPMRRKGEARPA